MKRDKFLHYNILEYSNARICFSRVNKLAEEEMEGVVRAYNQRYDGAPWPPAENSNIIMDPISQGTSRMLNTVKATLAPDYSDFDYVDVRGSSADVKIARSLAPSAPSDINSAKESESQLPVVSQSHPRGGRYQNPYSILNVNQHLSNTHNENQVKLTQGGPTQYPNQDLGFNQKQHPPGIMYVETVPHEPGKQHDSLINTQQGLQSAPPYSDNRHLANENDHNEDYRYTASYDSPFASPTASKLQAENSQTQTQSGFVPVASPFVRRRQNAQQT